MFNKLKRIFSSLAEKITGKISEEKLNEILEEVLFELVECDVAFPVAEKIVEKIRETYRKKPFKSKDEVFEALRKIVLEILEQSKPYDLVEEVKRISKSGEPAVIVFLGINGVGKTTTIAKIAKKMRDSGLKVVLAAADTYRAGAQEQIEFHAKKLGLPVIKHKYGSDPAAVAYDAINYAKSRMFNAVLVDTAGRMHTDIDLVNELKKVVRVAEPHFKILVVDALTGNDAYEQAKMFEENIGVDGIVIAKMDADVKGGVALTLASEIAKPMIYVGTGQSYDNLEPFDPHKIAKLIFEGASGK